MQIAAAILRGERPPIPALELLPGVGREAQDISAFVGLIKECWERNAGTKSPAQDPPLPPLSLSSGWGALCFEQDPHQFIDSAVPWDQIWAL